MVTVEQGNKDGFQDETFGAGVEREFPMHLKYRSLEVTPEQFDQMHLNAVLHEDIEVGGHYIKIEFYEMGPNGEGDFIACDMHVLSVEEESSLGHNPGRSETGEHRGNVKSIPQMDGLRKFILVRLEDYTGPVDDE